MPYEPNGTLTTDTREIAISETWETQTDWEAYQSKNNVEITNGILTLAETAAIPASAVSRWTFDNEDTETGTAIDVWNNNDGAISVDATTGQPGANQTYTTNESYEFTNGGTSYVDYPSLSLSGSLTVGCWVNLNSISDQWMISNRGNGEHYTLSFGFGTDSANASFVISDGTTDDIVIDSSGFSTGVWYHIVGVYDTSLGEIRIYVDGTLSNTGTTSLSVSPTNSGHISGQPNGTFQVDGRIDDPRIYDKALSDTEVNDWYTTGSIL